MGNATGQIWGIEERTAQWPTPLSQLNNAFRFNECSRWASIFKKK